MLSFAASVENAAAFAPISKTVEELAHRWRDPIAFLRRAA